MTWSLSTRLTQLITTIVSLAILGRLLTPEDFGIFGIVIAINAIVMPVLDLGLQPVYVKLKHATEEISNVFFTTNLIVGLILALILTALAPIISKFYDLEILGILLLLLSVSIVFSSLSSQPRAVLAREKKFDQLGSCQISVSVSPLCQPSCPVGDLA